MLKAEVDGYQGLPNSLQQTIYQPSNLGMSETLLCKIITPSGYSRIVRVLLDGGSQITALRRNIATELNLKGPKKALIVGTSGAQTLKYTNQMAVSFNLASLDQSYITPFKVEAITMPKVTMDISPINIDPLKYGHLQKIHFTEKLPFTISTPTRVDLLIGQPITSYLCKQIIVGKSIHEPSAAIYEIGACLTGTALSKSENKANLSSSIQLQPDPPCDVKSWFSLENIGIENPSEDNQLTAEEQKAEDMMKANTYYDETNKCWHTTLLWADKPIPYTNIKRASCTASRIIKRFSKPENSNAWEDIQKIYQTNLDLGITELVPKKQMAKKENLHYICMSMVFKPTSKTTPVRPVFNANLEFGTGVEKTSFNKALLEGPNLLQQLPQLMIRFRCFPFVALLDISKLYSRIRVSENDAEMQRFFWTEEKMLPGQEKANLKSYRQNRLIFGSKSSPYQAQWVLRKHGEMFNCPSLLKNAYLDDIFVGNESPQKVTEDLLQLIYVLKQGDFPSQKIVSNSPMVINNIEEELRGPSEFSKIYGQNWNIKEDKLTFNFKNEVESKDRRFTKRQLLAEMMSLYDLLGFAQPFHLKAKLIFQETCKTSMKWDELLSEKLQTEINLWMKELPLLNKILVDRSFLSPGGKIIFIASFCDASNVGLGVNTYIVSEDKDGKLKSSLAYCKAKVLPLKTKFTTPKGELAAAQLNSRAGNYVANAVNIAVGYKPKVYYFSDSEINLYRLKQNPDKYKVWVANRLKAILQQTEVNDWKKVDTLENPADISSRGAYLSEFVDSELFFHGPKWLINPDTIFRGVGETLPEDQMSLEKEDIKRALQVNATFSPMDNRNDSIENLLAKCNNWRKVTHTLAWCKKFLIKLKNKVQQNKLKGIRSLRRKPKLPQINAEFKYNEYYLEPDEVKEIENLLFTYAQNDTYATEIALLKEGSKIPNNSEITKLIPIWDEKDLLLKHSSRIMGYTPIILPKDHIVTKLFILDIHYKFGHSGPSLTLYKIRKRTWIINGRQAVKNALFKCSCKKSILLQERMGKMPEWRTETTAIWSRVGTDVLGPFWVKSEVKGEGSIKTFAILWTDLVSRGVLIDLLYFADTESVLRSLRKLTSIYGSAEIYYSDNASYYKKASLEIKNFMSSINWFEVRKQAQKWQSKWIFATAASPFRNATSERLVRTIKESLAKVIKKDSLTFAELSTTLWEISSYINNRPIGFLSSDSEEDMQPISPSLLTIGREIENIGNYEGKDPDLQEIYHNRATLIKKFITNWSALYLQNLSPTNTWLKRNPYTIKEGMVLFIKDENKLKDLWQKGRVTKVITSKSDGIPRTVELKTIKGKIIRPIQKLAIPESQIIDDPVMKENNSAVTSNLLSIENIAIPEIVEEEELKKLLSLAPSRSPQKEG